MRKVARTQLQPIVELALQKEQQRADGLKAANALDVNPHWKSARQRVVLKRDVLGALKGMAGDRNRCMYCLDSNGSDIEHFWPKRRFPERMFVWPNLLLCCSTCGNLKLDHFPRRDERPLLLDPASDEPWESLDFDPTTGNLTARFDAVQKDWIEKGVETTKLLHLDRREELANGYLRSWQRICRATQRLLADRNAIAQNFIAELQLEDDHGLVDWAFRYGGKTMDPFSLLKAEMPEFWQECLGLI
jgi:uncharacterized protein (TIGR02646 family)